LRWRRGSVFVTFESRKILLDADCRKVESSLVIKLESLDVKGVAHVNHVFDAVDFLESDLLLRNKSLLATGKLNQNASTHDSSHDASGFDSHLYIANRVLHHLHGLVRGFCSG
jgi:hypothetical protein